MSNAISFSLDGRQIALEAAVFTLLSGRERKITAAEQAVLLRMVHPSGNATGVPANPSISVVAYLKHYKLLDRETERPTEDGEYVAGVILDRNGVAPACCYCRLFHNENRARRSGEDRMREKV